MYCSTNWEYVSLSDPETVKALLMFRSELDPTYGVENRDLLESGADLSNINENIHLTYIDLQKVIDKIKFTNRQNYYIELISQGMDEYDIAKYLNLRNPKLVKEVIDNICSIISNKNKEMWNSWVRWDYKRVETEYKQCSKCKEFKPKLNSYFRQHSLTRDGYQSRCRTCE